MSGRDGALVGPGGDFESVGADEGVVMKCVNRSAWFVWEYHSVCE